jgi:hypothetical protein
MGSANQDLSNPTGYEDIKKLAAKLGCPVIDLLVLASKNDPFYAGVPHRLKAATWFAEQWQRFGASGTHLRRLHYQIVSSAVPILKPDRMPYANTKPDWEYLDQASLAARYLGLVPTGDFVDRRSSDAEEYAEAPQPDPDPSALVLGDGLFISAQAPVVELPQWIGVGTLPRLTTYGFEARQGFHVEVWVEKSTQDDWLLPLAERMRFNVLSATGQISEIHCRLLIDRITESERPARILYISDFDPAGQSMPVAVARKVQFWVQRFHLDLDIQIIHLALTHEQCVHYRLPRQPIEGKGAAYTTQAQRMAERYGEGATELDALEALHPGELARLVTRAVRRFLDPTLLRRVMAEQRRRDEELYEITREVHARHAEEIAQVDARYATGST